MRYYTENQEDCMLALYELSGKNSKRATEMFNEIYGRGMISPQTITKRWKAEDLLSVHGGHRHGLTDSEVKNLWERCRGNIKRMSDLSGYKPSTLERRCYKLKLKPKNVPRKKKVNKESGIDYHHIPRGILKT